MDEKKQYDNVENVSISQDVIATVAGIAATEVEGVNSLTSKLTGDVKGIVHKKTIGKGVQITLDENNRVNVDLFINVDFGAKIQSVAENVQNAVIDSVSSMTGMEVLSVNVNVVGIVITAENSEIME